LSLFTLGKAGQGHPSFIIWSSSDILLESGISRRLWITTLSTSHTTFL